LKRQLAASDLLREILPAAFPTLSFCPQIQFAAGYILALSQLLLSHRWRFHADVGMRRAAWIHGLQKARLPRLKGSILAGKWQEFRRKTSFFAG